MANGAAAAGGPSHPDDPADEEAARLRTTRSDLEAARNGAGTSTPLVAERGRTGTEVS